MVQTGRIASRWHRPRDYNRRVAFDRSGTGTRVNVTHWRSASSRFVRWPRPFSHHRNSVRVEQTFCERLGTSNMWWRLELFLKGLAKRLVRGGGNGVAAPEI